VLGIDRRLMMQRLELSRSDVTSIRPFKKRASLIIGHTIGQSELQHRDLATGANLLRKLPIDPFSFTKPMGD
jgi:hypothetical protein